MNLIIKEEKNRKTRFWTRIRLSLSSPTCFLKTFEGVLYLLIGYQNVAFFLAKSILQFGHFVPKQGSREAFGGSYTLQ